MQVQLRLANQRVDQQHFQALVGEAVEALRTNHECDHAWTSRRPPLTDACTNCGFDLYHYCYVCQDCGRSVCRTCRFFRML
jgi:hypothetical protein